MTPPLLRSLVTFVACLSLAWTTPPDDLRVGHWVIVKGELVSKRTLEAREVEVLPPGEDNALLGTATPHPNPLRFFVLGQEVHTDARTEWSGMAAGNPSGRRVKVQGNYRGPRKFSADDVKVRDKGRDRIEGRIDAIERSDAGLTLTIMGFRVLVADTVVVETDEEDFGAIPLAPLVEFGIELPQRDDDDFIRRSIQLSDDLSIGGQLEYRTTLEDNFDLDDDRSQDRTDLRLVARAEAVWEPSDWFYGLVGFRATEEWRFEQMARDEENGRIRFTEAYGYWRDAFGTGFDVQAGRQDFDDEREWLYDQNLDAVRVIGSWPDTRLELSASSTFFHGSPRDEKSLNLIAYLSNNDRDRHLATYAIHRRIDASEELTHVGVRALGEWVPGFAEWLPELDSWAELAYLTGTSGGLDVSGWGFDVGATWSPERLSPFNATIGYAFGSGDDDLSDGRDGNFRQTGLNDNNSKLAGVTSFRYYGELAQPELSNLGILTAGIGARLAGKSSIDLIWHGYHQVHAVPSAPGRVPGEPDSDIDGRADGIHDDLGWEVDLVLGSRYFDGWQIELVGARYEPGDAYPNGDAAWLAKAQIRFSF